ncbi:transposase [Streptomyces adustus]|uniref:transposase n=1 Tax=Streptomyces adustus TaxID=1609272 RepID=UPI0035DBFB57
MGRSACGLPAVRACACLCPPLSPDPTAAIVDSQSLRAAANISRSMSGWGGGKKVGGRKWHVVVECLGLVLAVEVTPASVPERDAVLHGRLRAEIGGSSAFWPTA